MRRYALVGEKISYTISPKLHNIFFQQIGIAGDYSMLDGESEDDKVLFLKSVINRIRSGDLKGVNITVPYKEEILKYIDILDCEAEKIGSVNTLVLENGYIKGYNTDYIGVLATFEKMKLDIKNKKVYILGNGGSAKSVAHAVDVLKGKSYIVSRKIEDGDNFSKIISYSDMEKIVLEEKKESYLVNTTPLGNMNFLNLSPISKNIAKKFDAVLDLNYRPQKTKLMKCSVNSENGLYMLVVQGIESQKIWDKTLDFSNKKDIIEKIYKELKEELEKNE
ncbi:MAG: shikimate dehydrogenase family protein [Cetobacterium sp.]